jgi:DNA-binding transcriptional MerR regulator
VNGNEPDERWLGIGEVARRAEVSVDTVRHYEKLGLLGSVERSAAGYRRFRPGAPQRIVEIRSALDLGFGLAELVVAVRSRERGHAPCGAVRELLAAKRVELDREIALLKQRRRLIEETLETWDRRLKSSPAGQPVGLLFGHGIPESPVPRPSHVSRRFANPRSGRKRS